jgi:transcriptional regulator of acetoin/glycerol metabolism
MNRYSKCVKYWESKLNHDKEGFVLDKIGMTADEVRMAMRKYCNGITKRKPTKVLNNEEKQDIKTKIKSGKYTTTQLSEIFDLERTTIFKRIQQMKKEKGEQ